MNISSGLVQARFRQSTHTMSRRTSGRLIVILIGLWAAFGLAAVRAHANESNGAAPTINVVKRDSRTHAQAIVGAYYYPWYHGNEKHGSWRRVFRRQLVPPQAPKAGLYRSDNADIIKLHIAQSMRAGLSFWAASWWGPDTAVDRNLLNVILGHPEAQQFRFAVLYESTGRFGEPDAADYSRWGTDLDYL
jgi:hypothetical protein